MSNSRCPSSKKWAVGRKQMSRAIEKVRNSYFISDSILFSALYLKMVTQRNDDILNVVAQTDMEKLISYEDRFPCLEFRKYLLKVKIKVNQFAVTVITNKVFEYGTITVILLNSL